MKAHQSLSFLAALCVLAPSCVHRAAPVRLPEQTAVAVAYVVDSAEERSVGEPPEALKAALEAELRKRNLEPVRLPFEKLKGPLSGQRDTPRRFALLREQAQGAPLLLLVELKTQFFSQLSGQYRWQVFTSLSAGKTAEAVDPSTESFETPVFLFYDHYRGPQALAAAAGGVAERAGALFDGLLGIEAAPAGPPPPDEQQPPLADGGTSAVDPGVLYFVMVDRFHNGDRSNDGQIDLADPNAFHGGDLQGVLDKLDHLQALGVDTVWLSPVFKMRTEKFFGYGAYHGYWTYDLHQVEPRFGDERLLRKLSDELHRRGMKLLLDLVLNHVGPDAPLAAQRPQWFHRQGALEKWDDPVELVNKDVHGLPDFAQENEEVYRYLLQASLGWIDRVKPDGFRLDAVKHIPSSFWARFNRDVRAHAGADFILLGEMLDGDAKSLARTWREGGFTHMFDFPLHFAALDVLCRGQGVSRLAVTLSQDPLYQDPMALVTLVDNHDLARVTETCAGAKDGVRQSLELIFHARGSPSLTWGTEIGLRGAKEPHNRGDMRFTTDTAEYALIRELALLREADRALQSGVPAILHADRELLAYARLGPDGARLFVFNSGAEGRALRLPPFLKASALEVPPRGRLLLSVGPSDEAAYRRFVERAQVQWRTRKHTRPVAVSAAAPVQPGDALWLVGSAPELGGWNPASGLGPLLEGSALHSALPEGFVYEYKLVIRRRDGRTEWEPGDNRTLFVSQGAAPLELQLAWGKRERNG